MTEAILLDLDGVLVDVSASYRRAIKKTVGHFLGVEISLSEIQEYKNRGGYNNDWNLTEVIIISAGKRIERECTIQRFQAYYLGNDFDGLITNELWLLKRSVLNKAESGEQKTLLKQYGAKYVPGSADEILEMLK